MNFPRPCVMTWFASSAYVSSMPYLHYPDREHLILDGIDDSVPTLPNTISFLSCEFFMAFRAGILSEHCNTLEDLVEVFLRNCAKVFFY